MKGFVFACICRALMFSECFIPERVAYCIAMLFVDKNGFRWRLCWNAMCSTFEGEAFGTSMALIQFENVRRSGFYIPMEDLVFKTE